MREKPPVGTSVLDELVFVGRSGTAGPDGERPHALAVPVLADPEPAGPDPTVRQRVGRLLVLALLATAVTLIIGLAIGYAA